MDDFEFLRNITIGQYLPTASPLHRLDPRAKILAFIALIAAVTFTSTYLGNLLLLAIILALVAYARIPLAYALAGLRPALPFILVLISLQLFFAPVNPDSPVLLRLAFLTVTADSARQLVVSFARFAELILLVSLLTLATATTELAHGVESLLAPLQKIRVPAHEFALVLTIALRFVPLLAEETERLIKAQVSRGADFGAGSRWRFVQQTRRMLPLFVPLFLAALQRAEELIVAMEARGYLGSQGRTRFVELRATRRDVIAAGVAVLFAVLMLLWHTPF